MISQWLIKKVKIKLWRSYLSKNEIKRGAVELTKVDDAGKPLKDVEFTLYHKGTDKVVVDKAGKELKDLKTDKDGKIRVDGLLYGEYYFKESKALEGYVLDPKNMNLKLKNQVHSLKTVKQAMGKL